MSPSRRLAGAQILVAGATGVVGTPLTDRLRQHGASVTAVARRGVGDAVVSWDMREGPGSEPIELRRTWDVVVNAAASIRWTMSQDEAMHANVTTAEACAALVGSGRFVHLSTAFAGGLAGNGDSCELAAYRNEYEWSKAVADQRVRALVDPSQLAIVAPPLIVGARSDGAIARFTGTYSLLHTLTSGLLAAVVGDRNCRIEVAPVDDVVQTLVEVAIAEKPAERSVLGAGPGALTIGELLTIGVDGINEFRADHGFEPFDAPPFIAEEPWQRFYLPFAREMLTARQLRAIDLLAEFQAYTTASAPIAPTVTIDDPATAFRACVRYWCERHRKLALRTPQAWSRKVGSATAVPS